MIFLHSDEKIQKSTVAYGMLDLTKLSLASKPLSTPENQNHNKCDSRH